MPACLEIACFSPKALLVAARAGAQRLEYCASYAEGGITPVLGTLSPIRRLIHCPVRVMIRCRPGGFVFTSGEIMEMRHQLRRWADEGVDGWVGGCLTPDGMPDTGAMLSIAQSAPTLPFTFHRAFDRCLDPISALHQLKSLGCSQLLSSGNPAGGAAEGIDQLLLYLQQLNGDAPPRQGADGLYQADADAHNQKDGLEKSTELARQSLREIPQHTQTTRATKTDVQENRQSMRLMVGGGIRRANIKYLFEQLGGAVDYHSAAVTQAMRQSPSTEPQIDPEEINILLNILK